MNDRGKRPLILHLRASNFLGGPERQILRYAEAERDGIYEIAIGVLCGEHEGIEFANAVQFSGFRLLRLPSKGVAALRALLSFLGRQNVALICCHGYKADILGILAALRSGVPAAAFLRGWTGEDWKVACYEIIDRWILRFADRIVCLSQTQANQPELDRLRDRICIVINAMAVPCQVLDRRTRRRQLQTEFRIPDHHVIIASAGRLSPEKGSCYFLNAAKLIHSSFPNSSFIIFGEGRERQRLEEMIRELDLRHTVILAGHRRDFPDILPGLDILVNPSIAEQSPNVVLEAMAVGVPVIATEVGAVAEIGSDGSLLCVPCGDASALASAVMHLLNSPQLAASLACAGPRRIAQAYSADMQKKQLRELYRGFSSGE